MGKRLPYVHRGGDDVAIILDFDWSSSSYMVRFENKKGYKGWFNIKPFLNGYFLEGDKWNYAFGEPRGFGRLTADKRKCIEDAAPKSVRLYTDDSSMFHQECVKYDIAGTRPRHMLLPDDIEAWMKDAFRLAYQRDVLRPADYKSPFMMEMMKDQYAPYIDEYNDCIKSMSEKIVKKKIAERSFLKHDYDDAIQKDRGHLDDISNRFSKQFPNVSLEEAMVCCTGANVLFEHGVHKVYMGSLHSIFYENLNTGEKTYADKVHDDIVDSALYKSALKKAVKDEVKRQEYEQKKMAAEQAAEDRGVATGSQPESDLEA